tara:strand:- start:73 stop:576 length:504 start_codon:yes stop_codon:yes gene_type:complete
MNAISTSVYNVLQTRRPSSDYYATQVFTQHRVLVPYEISSWRRSLSERFEDLTKLPIGWDGYNGVPVSFRNACYAAQLIEKIFVDGVSTPSIVPGSDGTLQLEWHELGYDIEVDIRGPLKVFCYRQDIRTGDEDEVEITDDFTILSRWIDDLAMRMGEGGIDERRAI